MAKKAQRRESGGEPGSLAQIVAAMDDDPLSRAGNEPDLLSQFATLARTCLNVSDIVLFQRPGNSTTWQVVRGGWTGPFPLDVPADHRFSFVQLVAPLGASVAVQPLSDGSDIAVILGPRSVGYSEADRSAIRVLTNLLAHAHALLLQRQSRKTLVFSLNHRLLQLNSLIDTGIEVSKLEQGNSMHRLALERAASLTNASRGILTVSSGGTTLETIVFPSGSPQTSQFTNRIAASFTFRGTTYAFELQDKESRHGVIPFEDIDELLLSALVRQVEAAIENNDLHKQALEKLKIENDIRVAASIQQRILPKVLPKIPGYDLAGINIPTRSVGGDYYDCIPLRDGRYALVVADVAGKGVPAALLVSSFHAYLSAYLEGSLPTVELMQRMNRVIYQASPDDKFITAFFAFLDPGSGQLETVSAGHNPVYWYQKDGSVSELIAGGPAFGMLDMEFPYQSDNVRIGPGDRLFLYTDGVTEAANEANELYDNVLPLKTFPQQHSSLKAHPFITALVNDVKKFSGAAAQSDDITAMYLVRD